MGPKLTQLMDFDIDDYLNKYIPEPRLSRLPRPISRFLGYRNEPYKEPPHLIICLWSFVGAICGLLLIGALLRYVPGLSKHNPPIIFASLGASAVLDYNAIRTPLSQPRNAFFGQTLSAIIGVAITKSFQRRSDFDELQWIVGAICCATASLAMSLTGTVHPPGGATAVLAATNAQIIRMGWIYVPFIMLSSVLMLAVALLVNNIQRSYPVYWWTARELRTAKDEADDLEKIDSNTSQAAVLRGFSVVRAPSGDSETVVVGVHHVYLPEYVELRGDEVAVLKRLQARLRWGLALDETPSGSVSGPGTNAG